MAQVTRPQAGKPPLHVANNPMSPEIGPFEINDGALTAEAPETNPQVESLAPEPEARWP